MYLKFAAHFIFYRSNMDSMAHEEEAGEDDELDIELLFSAIFASFSSFRECYGNMMQLVTSSMYPFVSFMIDKIIMTGSTGDGSCVLSAGLGFPVDYDIMFCFKQALALTCPQNLLLMTDPSIYVYYAMNAVDNPGYFYLRLFKEGQMLPVGVLSPSLGWEIYIQKDGQLLLSSERFNKLMMGLVDHPRLRGQVGRYESSHSMNGPALTTNTQNFLIMGFINVAGMDFVSAVKCNEIPDIAQEFFERLRGKWPPQNVLEEIRSSGCYFVPKGLTGSDAFEYEWCISFAHAEKMLVQAMDSTAFGVLGMLKLLRHEFFRPKLGDRLTSYMLKTSYLWTLEEINYGGELDRNISSLIGECLRRVLLWVGNGDFPHYFVREMNITKHHFSNKDRRDIIICLTDALQRTDQIMQDIYSKLMSSTPMSESLQRSLSLVREGASFADISYQAQRTMANFTSAGLSIRYGSILGTICKRQTNIEKCLDQLYEYYDSNKSHLSVLNRKQLLGKIFRFKKICDSKVDDAHSENYVNSEFRIFENSCIEDNTVVFSNIIDLSASCIFAGKIQEGVKFLNIITQFFITNGYHRNMYLDAERLSSISPFVQYVNSCTEQSMSDRMIIDNVIITVAESAFSPDAILLEVKCLIHLSQDENIKIDAGLNVLHIDPLIYTYFLLFLCYHRMQENIKQLSALEDLKRTCHHLDIDCPDIAWNLLGYCYKEMNQEKTALTSFYRALQNRKGVDVMVNRRPSQATPVFIAILINNHLIKEWSNIYG